MQNDLLIASHVFYAAMNPLFVVLLLGLDNQQMVHGDAGWLSYERRFRIETAGLRDVRAEPMF